MNYIQSMNMLCLPLKMKKNCVFVLKWYILKSYVWYIHRVTFQATQSIQELLLFHSDYLSILILIFCAQEVQCSGLDHISYSYWSIYCIKQHWSIYPSMSTSIPNQETFLPTSVLNQLKTLPISTITGLDVWCLKPESRRIVYSNLNTTFRVFTGFMVAEYAAMSSKACAKEVRFIINLEPLREVCFIN